MNLGSVHGSVHGFVHGLVYGLVHGFGFGGLKEIIQFSSYRLAKPLKPIKFPKVEKSEANWPISHRAQLGLRWPKSKNFKAQNQALAFRFQGKKRFGSIQLF